MNLADFRRIHTGLDADLKAVFAKYGLAMDRSQAKVGSTTKLAITLHDANLKDEKGNATTPDAERYKHMAEAFGLERDWLNKTFNINGKPHRVTGMNENGRRNIINVVCVQSGKGYVCGVDTVRMGFGKPRSGPVFTKIGGGLHGHVADER